MTSPLYIDYHILQNVPPSNLNRDDAGSPKHAQFGGARRARVSSQAWKRATRVAYAESVSKADRATRTKKIAALLAERLQEREGIGPEEAARLATALLAPLGITMSQKKSEETSYLLFFGRRQLDAIAGLVHGRVPELLGLEDKELATRLGKLDIDAELMRSHPAEVALFGRMVANRPEINVDASVQVAHALSTHPVESEFDYYTAVDDENDKGQTGAGMIGTIEFNSATLYRYATLGLHQLYANLGGTEANAGDAAEAAKRFTETFATSMPTGHQNSFAHRTLPYLVVATLRADQPVNLISAFEKPVRGTNGLADASAARLAAEALAVRDTWGSVPLAVFASYSEQGEDTGKKLSEAFGASLPFPQLAEKVEESALTWLEKGTLA
ncbi:type I-E CRISPR-associated protein Cas7/Cse4/CasC [Streptomyces sp. 8K308]|uniref:type I-E CRISPR-associated protein Cas7/Cse4/CasC n=1 Tax=Streptomyces sp. 8K308 TaxID=2530388 RepID=UPI00104DA87B|nr:type I-E CRISPR-associated protein Cas7/Cse4/CasC [Streptomyces sp. 8K308]TDC10589.1 type I-E CRISPR-associated protein Cas7/Cse4/CasC [Streptomyces sp. 8K308]